LEEKRKDHASIFEGNVTMHISEKLTMNRWGAENSDVARYFSKVLKIERY
jgi:hypothetical protein